MENERGLTLIELLVYSMLSIIVLTIVGGLLISSLRSERSVRGATDSAAAAQLVAQSFGRGVRDARALNLANPTATSQVLRALVVDDATSSPGVVHCQAWYFGNGEIRSTRSSGRIAVPASPADVGGWTLLAVGVTAVAPDPVFAVDGLSAALKFQVDAAQGTPALINTSAVSRQRDPIGGQLSTLPSGVTEGMCF